MSFIVPKGQLAPVKGSPLTVEETEHTALIVKAKELLTKPMSKERLMDVLEHWSIFGTVLEGKIDGKHQLKKDWVSKHYTSKQLAKVVDEVMKDLAPKPVEDVL